MSDPTTRVLRLLSLLQMHRTWSGAELADRLRVSERTLRRDVDRLRELGYPVDGTRGAEGGYRLAAGADVPPLVIDDDEAVAIAIGLRTAATGSVAGIEETSVRALAKLEQVLPARLRRRVAAVHGTTTPLTWAGQVPSVDPDALAVLALACRDGEQVRFDYERRDGEVSRRLVEPHRLVPAGRRWYLVAWDVRRDDWRTFRVDRLRDPRLAGVRVAPRELPAADAAAFVAAAFEQAPSRHHVDLTVRAAPDEVAGALRWVSAEVVDRGDGTCAVRAGADAEWSLVLTVALVCLEHEAEVHGPPEVAAAVAALADRLARAAGGGGGEGAKAGAPAVANRSAPRP
jgi:predicted DNA-binding transcriptional regulator YafY